MLPMSRFQASRQHFNQQAAQLMTLAVAAALLSATLIVVAVLAA